MTVPFADTKQRSWVGGRLDTQPRIDEPVPNGCVLFNRMREVKVLAKGVRLRDEVDQATCNCNEKKDDIPIFRYWGAT